MTIPDSETLFPAPPVTPSWTEASPTVPPAPDGVTIPAEQEAALESLRIWIQSRTGLHFGERKRENLYRRLLNLCWRLRIPDLKALERHIWMNDWPGLASELACAVSTSHSYFFREPEVLQLFQEQILPRLPRSELWRIWSAAAAGGEEAYTVAILLSEALGIQTAKSQAMILGTDISSPMIQNAEHGVYVRQRLELVSDSMRNRYFTSAGLERWRIHPDLKEMCVFRRMNLVHVPWPFQFPFHVILCRNILYYFDREQQQDLIERLYDVAAPQAWLITSVTETLHGLFTRWRRISSGVYGKGQSGNE